jgi:hypothetical protein
MKPMTCKQKQRTEKIPPNILIMKPRHAVKWERNEQGLVTLLVPRLTNRIMIKYLLPHLKERDFKIKLDEFGSCVWQQIDNRRTVMQIAGNLKEQFGERVEPVYERLGLFINLLARRKFIVLESENQ